MGSEIVANAADVLKNLQKILAKYEDQIKTVTLVSNAAGQDSHLLFYTGDGLYTNNPGQELPISITFHSPDNSLQPSYPINYDVDKKAGLTQLISEFALIGHDPVNIELTDIVPISAENLINNILLSGNSTTAYLGLVGLLDNDTVATGSDKADAIEVGAGNDTVTAGAGNDVVYKWKAGRARTAGIAGHSHQHA